MSGREPFEDPVLGAVVWNGPRNWWDFTVTLPSGSSVHGIVDPSDHGLLDGGRGIDEIRERVRWVIDNEAGVRHRVAEALYPGWRSNWEGEIRTFEEFRDAVSLNGMSF